MAEYVPTKQHLREVLIYHFNQGKTAAESYRLLSEIYPDHVPNEKTCRKWFARFKTGDFDVKDKERPGQQKKFEDAELEALLDQDPCQTQWELASSLGVDQKTVCNRLKKLKLIQKQGHWLPYELKPRDVERRFLLADLLLERQQRKRFLHRIVTGDEKWIHYDNPKMKKGYAHRGEPLPSTSQTPRRNIHGSKVMLCIWWDQLGVIHYELLKSGQTINGDLYRQQIGRLSAALKEKRPQFAKRRESVIFQHDNARPHIAATVKNKLQSLNWEVLPHPPYSPDIAPSDYYLFRSMSSGLRGKKFKSFEKIKEWLDEWIAGKSADFFRDGICKLPERWAKVVASDGQYFE